MSAEKAIMNDTHGFLSIDATSKLIHPLEDFKCHSDQMVDNIKGNKKN